MPEADDPTSAETVAAEASAEEQRASADRPPTPDEEAAADALPPLDSDVADSYEASNERGAKVQGEGEIT